MCSLFSCLRLIEDLVVLFVPRYVLSKDSLVHGHFCFDTVASWFVDEWVCSFLGFLGSWLRCFFRFFISRPLGLLAFLAYLLLGSLVPWFLVPGSRFLDLWFLESLMP